MLKKYLCFSFFILFISCACGSSEQNNVALVSVSTQYESEKISAIKKMLERANYKVTDKYLNQMVSDFGYTNFEVERTQYLVDAMLDDNNNIIWFVKGGAGAFNLLPLLHKNIEKLKKAKPKVLVGFSDVTPIHQFANDALNWKSLHGVVAGFNQNMEKSNQTKISINDQEPIPNISQIWKHGILYNNLLPLNSLAKSGANGVMSGGNLTLVLSSFATIYQPNFSDKILLLEDVGTTFRQLDRSLHQLLFMEKSQKNEIVAIVFGQFYPLDPTDPERLIYKTVIKKFAQKFEKPVCYFPYVGHGRRNLPVILGAKTFISCNQNKEYCLLKQKI